MENLTASQLLAKALEKQSGQAPPELPEGVNSKVTLSEWLTESGLKRGTKPYDELFSKLGESLPLEAPRPNKYQ